MHGGANHLKIGISASGAEVMTSAILANVDNSELFAAGWEKINGKDMFWWNYREELKIYNIKKWSGYLFLLSF